MGALAFCFDLDCGANDNYYQRETPALPCVRGSCHAVTEGAISQLIMQLISCHETPCFIHATEKLNITGKEYGNN